MRRYTYRQVYKWGANLSYIAGLIAADGCLYGDERHINLTSCDTDQLEIVRKILQLYGDIKQKPNGFGGVSYYLQFSNVALYDFLFDAGIRPAKSKTIGSLLIPDMYYPDFLRGYFDGDGCVYGFWDKRWPNSLMYYTEYNGASLSFLHWLQMQNTRLAKLSPGRIKPATRVHALSYAKRDSQLLFNFMYYSPTNPRLDRKYLKFIDFLQSDPYASKAIVSASGGMVDTLV
jgi:hypothetical protein